MTETATAVEEPKPWNGETVNHDRLCGVCSGVTHCGCPGVYDEAGKPVRCPISGEEPSPVAGIAKDKADVLLAQIKALQTQIDKLVGAQK